MHLRIPSRHLAAIVSQEAARRRIDTAMMLSAALPGIALALWLYGPALDPRHVEWLLAEGDGLQHFSGWDMFRRDDWRFPLGALPTLGSQVGASIVYTDSIPLVAIPLKLLHAWLPDPLQYIAPVMLVNLALNGAVAAGLLRWCGMGRLVAFIGALLVISLPMVTMRGPGALGHEALSSHWLLLLACWLFLVPGFSRSAFTRWAVLLVAAVLVHFYLFFMVGVLWVCWCVAGTWRTPMAGVALARVALGISLTVLLVLGVMYLAGYFQFSLEVSGDTGFGLYSSELASFFNPGSAGLFFQGGRFQGVSRLWQGWLPPVLGQYEGFAYAGLGLLLLWALALVILLTKGRSLLTSREQWLFAPLGLLFLFALGDQLVVGQRVVSLPYPGWLEPLTHNLRSSGRMAWPLLYGLLFAALLIVGRSVSRRYQVPMLCLLLVAQAWDISHWPRYLRSHMKQLEAGQQVERPFAWRNEQRIKAVLDGADELRFLPGDDWHGVKIISWLAARHELTSNVAYFARTNPGILYAAAERQRLELEAGQLEPGVVYALTSEALVVTACDSPQVICIDVNDMVLARIGDW